MCGNDRTGLFCEVCGYDFATGTPAAPVDPASLFGAGQPSEPAGLPDPALPDPGLPDPALPDPALPDPALPNPALPHPSQPDPAPLGPIGLEPVTSPQSGPGTTGTRHPRPASRSSIGQRLGRRGQR